MTDNYINILAVGVGGGLGAMCRYFFNISLTQGNFPTATFIENLFGSLLLGFITGISLKIIKYAWLKLALGTGFCGGFTTMSTFAADTFFISSSGQYTLTALYVVGTLLGALLAVHIGLKLGMKVTKQFEVMNS